MTVKLSDEKIAALRKLYENGMGTWTAAQKIKLNPRTVYKYYKEFGYGSKSETLKAKLKACYDSGLTPYQATEYIGCSPHTTLKYYEEFGYKPREVRISEGQIFKLRECYDKRLDIREAADKVDCSTETVLRYYKKFGYEPKGPTLTEEQISELLRCHEQGISQKKAAEIADCSKSAVRVYYKKFGHKPRERIQLTAEQKNQLKDHYKKGVNYNQAAKKVGCGPILARYYYVKFGWQPANKIRSPDDLTKLFEEEPMAKLVVERFGGDDADVADILAVVYEGRLSREDALRFFEEPSLRDYLGQFQRPVGGLIDFTEALQKLLPLDKNDVIREIVFRKAIEYRRSKLGPNPTKQQKRDFIKELEKELAA